MVKAVLASLARRYADQLAERGLELDRAVFNPARLTKLYGTMARKGDHTPDRPHRLARIMSLPEAREPVPVELPERIAECAISQEAPRTKAHEQAGGNFDVEGYLNRYGREVVKVKYHGDATLYCLAECIFDPAHSGGEAAIGPAADAILEALKAAPGGLTRTEINNLFGRNLSADLLQAAIRELLRLGFIGVSKNETRGRPSKLFFLRT